MKISDLLDPTGSFLGPQAPLPLDAPFTAREATGCGVSNWMMRRLRAEGLVRTVLPGVYVVSQVPDSIELRSRALARTVHADAVVVDRCAAWLHGVDVTPRTRTRSVPPLEVFHKPGHRLKSSGMLSGERALAPYDVTLVGGVRVTTPLRTALDLGRSLWRFDALAALDGFLRAGLDRDVLLGSVPRFRGHRGVVQLRALAPLADGRAESPGESALRLHWYDAGLPPPRLQIPIYADDGTLLFRLDLGLEDLLYAAEYDGTEHHTGDDDVEHDLGRRTWIAEHRGYRFGIFTRVDVYAPHGTAWVRLQRDLVEARSSSTLWTPARWVA